MLLLSMMEANSSGSGGGGGGGGGGGEGYLGGRRHGANPIGGFWSVFSSIPGSLYKALSRHCDGLRLALSSTRRTCYQTAQRRNMAQPALSAAAAALIALAMLAALACGLLLGEMDVMVTTAPGGYSVRGGAG